MVVCDGYVKYRKQKFSEFCKISEIMRKTIKKSRLAAILDFISVKIVMDYDCERPYILFYIHVPAILHIIGLRKYHKIMQIHNGR